MDRSSHPYAVLGHGKGFFSFAPQKIAALGGFDKNVIAIAAGSNHCAALLQAGTGSKIQFRDLIDDFSSSDVKIEVEGQSRVFFAHRIILEARSRYLRSYLAAAEREGDFDIVPPGPGSSGGAGGGGGVQDESAWSGPRRMLRIRLASEHASHITVAGLLTYLYTDRCEAPPHMLGKLSRLAVDLMLHRLSALCDAAAGPRGAGGALSKLRYNAVPDSKFEEDMDSIVNKPHLADVIFHFDAAPALSLGAREPAGPEAGAGGDLRGAQLQAQAQPDGSEKMDGGDIYAGERTVLFAHKAILCRHAYFRSLLGGKFLEGTPKTTRKEMHGEAARGSSGLSALPSTEDEKDRGEEEEKRDVTSTSFLHSKSHSSSSPEDVAEVSMGGFLQDGIQGSTMEAVIRFLYTGSESVVC